jgi:hypothetical protein
VQYLVTSSSAHAFASIWMMTHRRLKSFFYLPCYSKQATHFHNHITLYILTITVCVFYTNVKLIYDKVNYSVVVTRSEPQHSLHSCPATRSAR